MNMDMSGHRIEPTILREYDIRGVIGETLSNDDESSKIISRLETGQGASITVL